ncbi:MAG: hypothetical protein J5J00_15775 [Deltaproteobacteria bacterium]|nr:hypothetical protein [Deltaproteobacteria bacterium]
MVQTERTGKDPMFFIMVGSVCVLVFAVLRRSFPEIGEGVEFLKELLPPAPVVFGFLIMAALYLYSSFSVSRNPETPLMAVISLVAIAVLIVIARWGFLDLQDRLQQLGLWR